MRILLSLLAAALVASISSAASRSLIVVNGLGETADIINLTDGTIAHNVATLGLAPNDFVVSDTIGIAINSISSDLYFFSLPSMTPTGSLYLGSNRNPYNGALVGSDTVIITNLISSTVTKVDVVGRTIVGEYNVGKSPEGIAVLGKNAYVCITAFDFDTFTYGQGAVQVFDLDADSVSKTIPVGTNPQDIAIGYDGYLYVACTGDYATSFGTVYKIDLVTGIVIDSVATGGSPAGLAATRSGMLFLAAGGFSGYGEIFTIELGRFAVVRGSTNPIHTDKGVTAVVAITDTSVASCNFSDDTVTEVDTSGHVLIRFSTGDGPVAAAKFPSCYVPQGDANASGEIDISDAVYLINYIFVPGAPLVSDRAADMNCDATVDISDAVAVIVYIFAGAPGSCGCAD